PILDQSDWEALQAGITARSDPVLRKVLEHNITDLAETLEKNTLSALAWMVADEIITFKLAIPQDKLNHGDFHDKFGIFTDAQGNQVSFNGSFKGSSSATNALSRRFSSRRACSSSSCVIPVLYLVSSPLASR